MPVVALPRPLTSDTDIHAALGFQDFGLIDWGFTEEDLPRPGDRRVVAPYRQWVAA